MVAALFAGCATARPPVISPPAPTPAHATLDVAQDEHSLEERVAAHLRKRQLSVELRWEGRDAVVVLNWRGKGKPDFRITVDSQPSAGASTQTIRERVVIVRLLTRVFVPAERRAEVLTLLNARNAEFWAGSFYVQPTDGEIEARWALNIPQGETLASEMVFDAIVRLVSVWAELYPTLGGAMSPGRDA
ncbi:MAG: YbjN domain-containing protein [Myxococcota bacterium]